MHEMWLFVSQRNTIIVDELNRNVEQQQQEQQQYNKV